MTVPPDMEMATQFECRCCSRTERFDGDVSNIEANESGDWEYVDEHGIDTGGGAYFSYLATCPACIARAADGAVQSAREAGLVACLHPDHGRHVPGSDAFAACRETGYLPLTEAEYERVMAAYHDARERCCPACGRAGSLRETTVEYQGFTLDGATCVCGWTGREKALSYRKPTDARNTGEGGTDG